MLDGTLVAGDLKNMFARGLCASGNKTVREEKAKNWLRFLRANLIRS